MQSSGKVSVTFGRLHSITFFFAKSPTKTKSPAKARFLYEDGEADRRTDLRTTFALRDIVERLQKHLKTKICQGILLYLHNQLLQHPHLFMGWRSRLSDQAMSLAVLGSINGRLNRIPLFSETSTTTVLSTRLPFNVYRQFQATGFLELTTHLHLL